MRNNFACANCRDPAAIELFLKSSAIIAARKAIRRRSENCLRSFLRYLMSDHLKQAMCVEECCGRVEAYVDSNWARNVIITGSPCQDALRLSMVDGFPVKGFTRQQTSVALSSAEAELIALTEGANRRPRDLFRFADSYQRWVHAWPSSEGWTCGPSCLLGAVSHYSGEADFVVLGAGLSLRP